MKVIHDYQGLAIRLTNERLAHVLDHPELSGQEDAVAQTLIQPHKVIQSISDSAVRLYYRLYQDTPVGDKLMCVAVKVMPGGAFISTAYLTDQFKKGKLLWSAST